MKSWRRARLVPVVAIATAAAVAAIPPATAAGGGSGVSVVAKGLNGPFGVHRAPGHKGMVVAEGDTGQVTRVFMDGRKHVLLRGAAGVAGVAASPSRVFAVTGGGDETGPGGSGPYAPAKVIRMDYRGKHVKVIADLMKYELRHNPDGQVQFNSEHVPYDALSNPFSMTWSRFGLFVADGGANDVLRINPRTGHVSTFFVPPTVKDVAACKAPEAQANPGTKGCDPVPTGVQVRGGSLYVSTLGAEAPGAGRLYKLNAHTGKVQRVWKGFDAPTGIAVRKDGTIYFSQVLEGAPAEPGPGFDPSTVGQVTRIRKGKVATAQVTMPTGLALKDGRLYATAWSIAGMLGIPGAGQVVRIRDKAFH